MSKGYSIAKIQRVVFALCYDDYDDYHNYDDLGDHHDHDDHDDHYDHDNHPVQVDHLDHGYLANGQWPYARALPRRSL